MTNTQVIVVLRRVGKRGSTLTKRLECKLEELPHEIVMSTGESDTFYRGHRLYICKVDKLNAVLVKVQAYNEIAEYCGYDCNYKGIKTLTQFLRKFFDSDMVIDFEVYMKKPDMT